MVIQWVGVRSEFLCVFAIYLVASEEYYFDDRDNDGHSEHGSKILVERGRIISLENFQDL